MPVEPIIRESAKERSLRVPLDYYRQRDPLTRARLWLSGAAVVVAASYAGWILTGFAGGRTQISPGAVATAHAAWQEDCQVCHAGWQPLRQDAVGLLTLAQGQTANRHSSDQACLACHQEPAHHQTARAGEAPTCAACHREHQGAAADIVRPTDEMCLVCHRDLSTHRTIASPASFAEHVTGFGRTSGAQSGPHPEFRSLNSDPGNVKFNHWLHLQPGIAPADSLHKFTLPEIRDDSRSQYAPYAMGDRPLQLDCAACHEPQGDGRQMQPILYERHCRGCHPLDARIPGVADELPVPHGLSQSQLTTAIDGMLFAAARAAAPAAPPTADESGDLPLVPGKTLGNNLAQKIDRDVLGRRGRVAAAVQARCEQCHVARPSEPAPHAELLELEPAAIPAVWLKHGMFDHSAHRHVQCRTCHGAAYSFEQRDKPQFVTPSPGGLAATDNEQVMIAGLESCAGCHAPARGEAGGARHDCAECHTYHGKDAHPSFHLSFPGSSLGTQGQEAPASSDQPAFAAALVSFVAPAESPREFVGSASCAASHCHGRANSAAPAWQTAFTNFASADPHVRAADVLWTFRAREITRLLSPLPAGAGSAMTEYSALSDDQHRQQLETRCLACHATPPPPADQHANYTLGVQCESCHGPAATWQHTHYRRGFDRSGNEFIDTKVLQQRAAVCLPCHVGPAAGGKQPVDHDLIAAGHPRLMFEFHAYFEQLPAHWDRPADEHRQAGDFHFRSWLAGQEALRSWQDNRQPAADFADFDCFRCHHQLQHELWRGTSPPWPLEAEQPWVGGSLPGSGGDRAPIVARLALARGLLEQRQSRTGWNAAVRALLAAKAVLADLPPKALPQSAAELHAAQTAMGQLGRYLSRDCFTDSERGEAPATPYDSPRRFSPAALAERVETLCDRLRVLETNRSTTPAP